MQLTLRIAVIRKVCQRERDLGLKERPNADSLRLQLSTLSSGEPDKGLNPQLGESAARAALPECAPTTSAVVTKDKLDNSM